MELHQILERAAQICTNEEKAPRENPKEPMDAGWAWSEALGELVDTDRKALDLITQIISDPQLNSGIHYWGGEDADGETFKGFVIMQLICAADPFVERIKPLIPNYEELIERRRKAVTETT